MSEKYKPSLKEERAAEDMMSDEQREASNKREKKLLLKELSEMTEEDLNKGVRSNLNNLLYKKPQLFYEIKESYGDYPWTDIEIDNNPVSLSSADGILRVNATGVLKEWKNKGGGRYQINLSLPLWSLERSMEEDPKSFHLIKLAILKERIENYLKIVMQARKAEKSLTELEINPDDPKLFKDK